MEKLDLVDITETKKYGENQRDTIISRYKFYRKGQEGCYGVDVALYIKE